MLVSGTMSVSSCRCCMFVSCVHPVAVPNVSVCLVCCVFDSVCEVFVNCLGRGALLDRPCMVFQ